MHSCTRLSTWLASVVASVQAVSGAGAVFPQMSQTQGATCRLLVLTQACLQRWPGVCSSHIHSDGDFSRSMKDHFGFVLLITWEKWWEGVDSWEVNEEHEGIVAKRMPACNLFISKETKIGRCDSPDTSESEHVVTIHHSELLRRDTSRRRQETSLIFETWGGLLWTFYFIFLRGRG